MFASIGAKRDRRYGIGRVRYVDFQKAYAEPNHNFLFKRVAFEAEKEVRLFHRAHSDNGSGMRVSVDLSQLMSEVIYSPDMPGWLMNALSTLLDQTCPEVPRRRSDLMEEPF